LTAEGKALMQQRHMYGVSIIELCGSAIWWASIYAGIA
jgi:hypothetical protein